MAGDNEQDVLLELERRSMAGDPAITPDIAAKIKTKLEGYRQQGIVKPLQSDTGKPMPAWAAKPFEDQVGIYGGIRRGADTFKDEYAGNAITGGLENDIQSAFSSFGSEGQRDWWAQFGSTDNVIRNDLFGAALTESEKAAYAATTVTPRMDPKEVRRNLTTRKDILTAALKRRVAFLKAQGYSKEAIEAQAGEYAQDLGAAIEISGPDSTAMAKIMATRPEFLDRPETPASPADKSQNGTPVIPGSAADKANQNPLQPEQQAAYDAWMKANPKATADQLRSFGSSLGVNFDNAEAIISARDKGAGFQPGATARETAPDISDVRGGGGFSEGADAVVRGAADPLTLGFADEIAAAGTTLFKGGTMAENLSRERAIDAYDAENSPWLRGIGQVAGGIALPIGSGAKTVAELAGVGGITGAGYGIGSGETMADRVTGGVAGGLTGAALGASFGKLGDLYRARRGGGGGGGPTPPTGPDTLRDVANRLDIVPSPATVGGRGSEAVQIGLGNAPGSMGPVRAGVAAETEALGDAARATAARMGPVSTPQQAGEIISRGARVADRAQAREAGRAYNSRTAMMGGDNAPVVMGGSQRALASIQGDFASNEVIGDLLTHPLVRRLGQADANELTLSESTELLSEARRVLRKARETKQPGRLIQQVSDLERAIESDVMRAAQASDAIAGRARDAGAEAAQQLGDTLWSDRMQSQKQEFKRALSSQADDVNTSGESVYRQLFNDMRDEGGNLVRLRRTLDRLPRRARDTFAASAFDDLGKSTPGQQNAATDAWSFETFMTNWGKTSEEARRVAFGGRGVDREIGDIVRYAERLRELGRSRNFSNTAATGANSAYVTAVISTLLGVGPKAAMGVAGVYPAMNVAGRAFMATPALRSWLRSTMQAAVRGNNSQISTLTRRLPSLAAKNPTLSAEIGQVERALLSAVNDNRPMSAAASEDEQEQR